MSIKFIKYETKNTNLDLYINQIIITSLKYHEVFLGAYTYMSTTFLYREDYSQEQFFHGLKIIIILFSLSLLLTND